MVLLVVCLIGFGGAAAVGARRAQALTVAPPTTAPLVPPSHPPTAMPTATAPAPLPAATTSATPPGSLPRAPSTPAAMAAAAAPPASAATPQATPSAASTPLASITLSPSSGPPGTVVQISGFIPGAQVAASGSASGEGNVCWDGCPGGLIFEQAPVQWSSSAAGQFSMQFTVPSAPWLEADGAHSPVPGDYTVGVQCLAPPGGQLAGGCATGPAQASAAFHLTGPAPAACAPNNCASLTLAPAEAAPGASVQVQGNAPLVAISGGQSCCYALVLQPQGSSGSPVQLGSLQQGLDGTLSGGFQVPLSAPGLGPLAAGSYSVALQATPSGSSTALTLAPAPFVLDPAPSWAALGGGEPEFVQASTPLGGPVLAVDRVNPDHLAYCTPGAIQLSLDDGATWSTIATAGAQQAAAASALPLFAAGSPAPACVSAVVDPSNPQSLYATFEAAAAAGAPPIFFAAYQTVDGGQTWTAVPLPPGARTQDFGGFQLDGSAVQAFFVSGAATSAPTLSIEETSDSGATWSPSQLTCPTIGVCARWGQAPNGIGSCAMHEYQQPIDVSADAGQTWFTPGSPSGANACDANELVSFSASELALLSGRAGYPFQVSQDGGQTWAVASLPALPAVGSASYPGLQILPDGTLLSQSGSSWYLLEPGASAWCSAAGVTLPAQPQLLQASGGRLWWLQAAGTPASIPIGSLTCSGS